MPIVLEKNQIVSSTEVVRSFSRYVEKDLNDHDVFIFKRNAPEAVLVSYERYEKMKEELEELEELREHMGIFEIVERRKKGSYKKISLKKLQEKYDL
ncbi:hypothetical protein MNBD_UNCLBAC01-1008 [hydrothermal vent metagenome]|uniref:Antitoxin n=1 Tax=hydrothermal vent metagenome TaxID=652676 RepID=A0A3B1E2W1_9ZZZZ